MSSRIRKHLRTVRRAVLAAASLAVLTAGRLPAEPLHVSALTTSVMNDDRTPGSGWPTVLLAGIDLSAQQRARLDSIRTAYASRVTFDPSAPGAAQVSWAVRLQMRAAQSNAIRSVLTPAQRQIFDGNAERAREALQARIPQKEKPSRLRSILRMLRIDFI
jgi:Spy/CpxP family protein refolding chaperone